MWIINTAETSRLHIIQLHKMTPHCWYSYSMQPRDRSMCRPGVSSQDLRWVYLLALSNPKAFLRMGSCQIDRQSDRLFSTWLTCQIVDTQSGIRTHSHSFPSKGSHTQSGTHKYIHTHRNVLDWYDAQSVMTVSGPGVIEVTEAETGWGLSSAVNDRKLRVEGGDWQLSSSHAVYALCLCVCLTSLSGSLSLYLFLMPARLFQPLCLLCPVCLSLSLSFKCTYICMFASLSTGWWVDEFCPFFPMSDTTSRKTMRDP